MLNHARTLLMNVAGSSTPLTGYGDELVEPDFTPVDYPSYIDAIRAVLFGTSPDRYMLNYRCRQLLAVAHASPLADLLIALDSRVTYDFADTFLVGPAPWQPTVVTQVGTGTLTVVGNADPPDATGVVHHGYVVKVTGTGSGTIERVTAPIQKTVFDFTVGARVALPGSGVDFRLSSLTAPQTHRVDVYSRPLKDLSELLSAVSGIGEPSLLALFGTNKDEPYRTLRDLWTRSAELPLRVAALTVAVAYRSEEARLAAGSGRQPSPILVEPPIADFTDDTSTGDSPLSVQFIYTGVGGHPASFYWDFGDGETSTEENPVHVYTTPGTYTVTLATSNVAGESSKTRVDLITVEDGTLISHWPFSADFDDAKDGNDLTAQNGAAITGGVAVFEAANSEYADCPTGENILLVDGAANTATIIGWVKLATLGAMTIASSQQWRIDVIPAMATFAMGGTVGDGSLTLTGAPPVDEWFVVALQKTDGGGGDLPKIVKVVGGVLTSTTGTAITVGSTSENTFFGARATTPSSFFNGSLSGWKFYSRELSDAEIQAVYDAGPPA